MEDYAELIAKMNIYSLKVVKELNARIAELEDELAGYRQAGEPTQEQED